MKASQTAATPQTDTDQTARLRAVIGRLSRRLRPTSAGSELTPSQTSVLFTIVRLGPLGLSDVAEIVRTLDAEGLGIADLRLHSPTLDDVFLAKTGRSLEGAGDGETSDGEPSEAASQERESAARAGA